MICLNQLLVCSRLDRRALGNQSTTIRCAGTFTLLLLLLLFLPSRTIKISTHTQHERACSSPTRQQNRGRRRRFKKQVAHTHKNSFFFFLFLIYFQCVSSCSECGPTIRWRTKNKIPRRSRWVPREPPCAPFD